MHVWRSDDNDNNTRQIYTRTQQSKADLLYIQLSQREHRCEHRVKRLIRLWSSTKKCKNGNQLRRAVWARACWRPARASSFVCFVLFSWTAHNKKITIRTCARRQNISSSSYHHYHHRRQRRQLSPGESERESSLSFFFTERGTEKAKNMVRRQAEQKNKLCLIHAIISTRHVVVYVSVLLSRPYIEIGPAYHRCLVILHTQQPPWPSCVYSCWLKMMEVVPSSACTKILPFIITFSPLHRLTTSHVSFFRLLEQQRTAALQLPTKNSWL